MKDFELLHVLVLVGSCEESGFRKIGTILDLEILQFIWGNKFAWQKAMLFTSNYLPVETI